jgi:hypothetical protein
MDPDTMTTGNRGLLTYWAYRVSSIVDENNCILTLGNNSTIWLEAYPTADLVTDQSVRLIGPVEVTGTKEYQTVLGASRKVRSVRFLRPEEVPPDLFAAAPTSEPEFTVFHSTAGTTVEAKFIKYVAGLVHIETKDGRVLQLKLNVFIDDDADRIRHWARLARGSK